MEALAGAGLSLLECEVVMSSTVFLAPFPIELGQGFVVEFETTHRPAAEPEAAKFEVHPALPKARENAKF